MARLEVFCRRETGLVFLFIAWGTVTSKGRVPFPSFIDTAGGTSGTRRLESRGVVSSKVAGSGQVEQVGIEVLSELVAFRDPV